MVTDNFYLILKAKFLEETVPDILHLVKYPGTILINISFQTHIKITIKDIMDCIVVSKVL